MNRRSFFTSFLGAACLAVAERIMPSSVTKLAAPQSIDDLHRLACDMWSPWGIACSRCGRRVDRWVPSAVGLGINMRCPCGSGMIGVEDASKFREWLLSREMREMREQWEWETGQARKPSVLDALGA